MAYLERGQPPAAGGNNDVLIANALQDVFEPYQLQYPALMTNQAGWEVQSLVDRLGWTNGLLDKHDKPLVFSSKQAALDYMATMEHDGVREYRIYPSFSAPGKLSAIGWKTR